MTYLFLFVVACGYFVQVDLVCRHIVEEHDVRVREHFDQVLNNKLAGMTYDQFLRISLIYLYSIFMISKYV